MKSVVIVDDHPVLSSAIASALERQEIANAITLDPLMPDAEQSMIDMAPDLCLLDLDLGQHQAAGMRFVRAAMRAGHPAVMFTGSTDEAALGRCIGAGALGVVQKTNSFDEVISQVSQVLAGGKCNSDTDLLKWVLAAQHHDAERRRLLQPFSALTSREQVVLQHLIDGQRVDEIASMDFVSVATVRSQIRAVLQKLSVKSQLAAVAKARQASWSPEAFCN